MCHHPVGGVRPEHADAVPGTHPERGAQPGGQAAAAVERLAEGEAGVPLDKELRVPVALAPNDELGEVAHALPEGPHRHAPHLLGDHLERPARSGEPFEMGSDVRHPVGG